MLEGGVKDKYQRHCVTVGVIFRKAIAAKVLVHSLILVSAADLSEVTIL